MDHYQQPLSAAKQARSEATRARLLDAALHVFAQDGFSGASLREISHRSETGIAATSYHFGSKEALYLAVAEEIVANIHRLSGPLLEQFEAPFDQTTDVPGLARKVVTDLVRLVMDEPMDPRALRFFASCETQGDAAFDLIKTRGVTPICQALTHFLMRIHGAPDQQGRFQLSAGALLLFLLSLKSQPNLAREMTGLPTDALGVEPLVDCAMNILGLAGHTG